MSKIYAGIGSRSSPDSIRSNIRDLVYRLNDLKYTLRSGGAPGADSYFEEFARYKEIYLPWIGFNNSNSQFTKPTAEAMVMASNRIWGFKNKSNGARLLLARNMHQILGSDLKSPVEFVICWTPGGGLVGGTSHALKLASDNNIPIYNIYSYETLSNLNDFIKSMECVNV